MNVRTIIETSGLRLRTWTEGDAEQFARHCNTEEVMRFLGGVQSPGELQDDVDYFSEHQEEHGHTFWVVERKLDRELLGFCGFVVVEDGDSTVEGELEIGWRIRADEWRKGYAEEAARAALDWAWETVRPRRIVSRVAVGNLPSQALMRKLGMRHMSSLSYVADAGRNPLLVYTATKQQTETFSKTSRAA